MQWVISTQRCCHISPFSFSYDNLVRETAPMSFHWMYIQLRLQYYRELSFGASFKIKHHVNTATALEGNIYIYIFST